MSRPEHDPAPVGAEIDDHGIERPDAHGKFSLSEDWIATGAGLLILVLCLVGIIPAGILG